MTTSRSLKTSKPVPTISMPFIGFLAACYESADGPTRSVTTAPVLFEPAAEAEC
jgi:hypothetical protein